MDHGDSLWCVVRCHVGAALHRAGEGGGRRHDGEEKVCLVVKRKQNWKQVAFACSLQSLRTSKEFKKMKKRNDRQGHCI